MDKKKVILLHNRSLLSGKNSDNLKFAGKWIELEEHPVWGNSDTESITSYVDIRRKAKDNQPTIHNNRETRQKGEC